MTDKSWDLIYHDQSIISHMISVFSLNHDSKLIDAKVFKVFQIYLKTFGLCVLTNITKFGNDLTK